MRNILFILLGIVLLGGLFFLFKSKTVEAPNNTQQNVTTAPQATSPTPENTSKTFKIVIKNKKMISGADSLKVQEGDEVTIEVLIDEEEELHLHGYDKMVDLEPNKQARLSFTANLSGRFPIELEHSKTDITALEVQPK